MKALAALTGCTLLLAGCGVSSPPGVCTGSLGAAVLSLSPAVATVSSSAISPGNQVQFHASYAYPNSTLSGDCVFTNVIALVAPIWTNSDPIHITISSADDTTNGTAVCKAPTTGPATLTATTGTGSNQLTATVQLTCQ